ncbi:MAG: KpsF/GutQ family sugar-phosphate isomerase [Ginsengibacter sp.]
MKPNDILFTAKRTIQQEVNAIEGLIEYANEDFVKAVQLINSCKGRVIVSGIGKSAIIAQKIVATLNSTGTPSSFMHAADAIHGDIGMVQQDDVVMVISKSGDSPEIKILIPLLKNFGKILIAMVGQTKSFLALQADIILNTTVSEEACPHNLAPTSSTTAQMVMGDALAMCLMEIKGFGSGEFARFHPGGTIGKKLYLRVADLYYQNEKPAVKENSSLKDVIIEITKKRLGATAVIDDDKVVLGIITDGDLRRMLEKNIPLEDVKAHDIMTRLPKTIFVNNLAVDALDIMRKNNINQLLVVDDNKYAGMIHLHDLVREGII